MEHFAFFCLDPEVCIALENLQQFPAFSSGSGELAGTENRSEALLSPLLGSPVSQPGKQLQETTCVFNQAVLSASAAQLWHLHLGRPIWPCLSHSSLIRTHLCVSLPEVILYAQLCFESVMRRNERMRSGRGALEGGECARTHTIME